MEVGDPNNYIKMKVADLRKIEIQLARIRRAVNHASLHQEPKIAIYTACKAAESTMKPYIQLSLFSPAQRAE